MQPYIKLIGGDIKTITLEQAKKIKAILDGELEPKIIPSLSPAILISG